MVEGISVTGINPTGFTLDYGAFAEVSVGTAAHGPEWPAPGIQMQFISKSGGNQYRGAVYGDYVNRDWQSTNIDLEQVRRGAQGGGGLSPHEANRLWSYWDLNADIGGYIKPDRPWWYSSVREQALSARQVNFPVKPLRTSLMNYSGKGTYQVPQDNKLVAFGQAVGTISRTASIPSARPALASLRRRRSTSRRRRRPSSSPGDGSGRASGTQSSMTRCSSRSGSDSSAPTGPRGRMARTILDVRVEKSLQLGGHRRVAGFVDVFNLLNANPEQNTNWSSGSSFLRPLDIVAPRLARVGVKLEW